MAKNKGLKQKQQSQMAESNDSAKSRNGFNESGNAVTQGGNAKNKNKR
ncbi:hypothetical protein SAMN02745163_04043 [Clostridium cavendishii DSM 21758]|uniref:Uncharacterized protein n=1 Tax=Clostridium cavendishii DSM 21758 TaxID=1121302 RepID=A0A1M6THV5_9CLOT|nr:hypothetical protein [Clostridium cavendishii]SHK56591.1 hypothetical protein SAMN02745163_04043 [Clostridium cavendishii DSM 21758]